MDSDENYKTICAILLMIFKSDDSISSKDIKNLKIHTSQTHSLGPIYTFDYNNRHYYLVDDYSLGDDPISVREVLSDVNHLLKGSILENPKKQINETKYAVSVDETEYYMWESPLL